jgi:heme oxygenase
MDMLEVPLAPKAAARAGGTIRFALRAATSDLHATVDSRFSGPFATDTAAYADFLQALARSVVPLERLLEAAGIERLLPDWPLRRRSALLVLDLERLGRRVPDGVAVPEAGNDAWLLGATYVLEGSRLGGKVLLRHEIGIFHHAARAATHYLRHGPASDLWPRFVEQLEGSPAVARSPDDAIGGARAAFALFNA